MTRAVLLGDLMIDKGYIRGPFGSALRRPEMKTEGIPVYEQQNAIYNHRTFRFFVDDEKYQELKRFTVRPGDLVISCSGTLGKITVVQPEDPIGIISQALLILRVDRGKVLPEYLYYFLTSSRGQYLLLGASHGSVQTNIAKRSVVEAITLDLPNLPEQQKLIDILGTIDEKIELNRKMNETLEQMGQALFRHYFINNPEAEKWQNGALEGFVKINKESIGKHCVHDQIIYVDISSVSTGSIDKHETVDSKSAPSRAKRIVHDGDIIWSTVRPNRRAYSLISNPPENMVVSTGFAVLSPMDDAAGFVYYLTTSQAFTDYLTLHARGAAYPAVAATDFSNAPTVMPDKDTLREFNELVAPNMRLMSELKQEIQTLTTIRDTLLPRLINGKVKL